MPRCASQTVLFSPISAGASLRFWKTTKWREHRKHIQNLLFDFPCNEAELGTNEKVRKLSSVVRFSFLLLFNQQLSICVEFQHISENTNTVAAYGEMGIFWKQTFFCFCIFSFHHWRTAASCVPFFSFFSLFQFVNRCGFDDILNRRHTHACAQKVALDSPPSLPSAASVESVCLCFTAAK